MKEIITEKINEKEAGGKVAEGKTASENAIMKSALENKDYVIALRRYFHQNPEASGQEINTSKRVCEELKSMGLNPKVIGKIGTGVMCDIIGEKPGKTILLRADMDALSVQELNEEAFKSSVDGLMHACGHDGHTATLLGAAKVLVSHKDQIKGRVRLLFQPAEETGSGAEDLIAAGCLKDVDAAMGIHLWSGMPSGMISVDAGPRMAAANWFRYRIKGKPGHGALPHEGIDAGLCAAAAALNLQSVVSREFPATEPIVITIGRIESGTRFNVIAAEALLEGTTRCFNSEMFRSDIPAAMNRIVDGTAAAYGCEVTEKHIYEATLPCVNPERSAQRGAAAVRKLLGEQAIGILPLSMGGEDFSYIMDQIEDSLFVFVGIGNSAKGSQEPHHSGYFKIDEDALENSVAFYAQYALDYLNE